MVDEGVAMQDHAKAHTDALGLLTAAVIENLHASDAHAAALTETGTHRLRHLIRDTVAAVRDGVSAPARSVPSVETVSVEQVAVAEAVFDAAIVPVSRYLETVPVSTVAKFLNGTIWRSILNGRETPPLTSPLTVREHEVLVLVAAAMTNRQIAAHLGVAPGTVKRHIANILARLDAVSRLDAVRQAHRLGLL